MILPEFRAQCGQILAQAMYETPEWDAVPGCQGPCIIPTTDVGGSENGEPSCISHKDRSLIVQGPQHESPQNPALEIVEGPPSAAAENTALLTATPTYSSSG